MKKTILTIVILISVLVGIQAQTNPPSDLPTFAQSTEKYFTTINTNFSFANTKLEISIGADYMAGVNWANYVKSQYDLRSFDIEANFRNIGIGGKIQSVEAGFGYALINHFDTKVTAWVDGGYDMDRRCGVVEPGATLKKKSTLNTYFETGISWPFYFRGVKNQYPNIRLGTGFTF